MHKAWASKKGFTVVELIITIIVIGILATIMIISYSGIQQRSRDSTRQSDITQLKIAIEKYRADNSQYPAICTTDGAACVISLLGNPLKPYLATIPHDPTGAIDTGADYRYVRGPVTTDSYAIRVNYEVKGTCIEGHNIQPGWWVGTPDC